MPDSDATYRRAFFDLEPKVCNLAQLSFLASSVLGDDIDRQTSKDGKPIVQMPLERYEALFFVSSLLHDRATEFRRDYYAAFEGER